MAAPAAKADTGFEVLDDEEPASRRDRDGDDELDDAGRPAVGRRSRDDDEDEEDDRPRSRRDRDDDEDEEDDRPRSRRDRDDEDDDDRDRARSRDDDDEDEDRPRRRDRDEDEEDDDEHPRGRRADDDEEEDDEDDRRPARSRSRDNDEDEDEDERPRSRRDHDDDEEDEKDDRRAVARDRDEEEEEEDEDDRPRRRDEDEDEEEDRPRSRRSDDEDEDNDGQVVARRRRPDEDEEEEDEDEDEDDLEDRDREKPKSKTGLLVLVLLTLLLVGAGGAAAGWYFFLRDPDTKAVASNTNNPPDDNQDAKGKGGPQVPVGPKGNGPPFKGPNVKGPIVPAGNVWKHPPRDLPVQPVRFTGERQSVTLPGTVTDVCAGGDGKFLFLHCADERKLLVFDVSSASVVKDFPTGGKEARFAAGATKLLLYDGIVRTLQRFDLVKMEKDKEEPLSLPGTIRDISLGSGSRGPALVLTDSPADAWPVHFLDLETLAPADVGWAAPPPTGLPRDLRFRASSGGSRWIGLPEGKDAKGAVLLARDGKGITATQLAPDKALGFAALSADGLSVYSRFGVFATRGPVPANPPVDVDSFTLPAVTGRFDVQVRPGEMPETVQVTVSRPTKGAIPKQANAVPQPGRPDEGPPDRFVHYVADAHALLVLQPARKKLEVVRLDPFVPATKSATITSTAPDAFTPGQPYEYPVRVLTNASQVTFSVGGPTEFKLQVGPDGVVRGTVPADEKRDLLQLQVSITADGARGTQLVKLFNTRVPAPKPTEPKKGPEPKKGSTSPEPKGPIYATGVKLAQPAAEKVPIPPAEMKDPHVEVALPGQAREVCVGGGGRYLIFHVPTARRLVVFDTSSLTAARSVPLATDELLFAAGMDKLLVVYPTEKEIVRYSLATLKPEADGPLETEQRPTFVAMGSATAGPLILAGVPGVDNPSKMGLTFLDIESFKKVKIDKAEGEFQVTTTAAAHLRTAADGRTLGLWRSQLSPSGVQIVRLDGNVVKGSYRGDPAGEVIPAPDGQKVYTTQGAYDLFATQIDPKAPAIPAVQGAGYVTLTGPASGKRTVAVWGTATDKPLFSRDDLPGFDGKKDPFERNNPNLTIDQRLFWIPDAGVLIVVPPAADRVHGYQVKK
jgi:hypothetical protein